MSETLEPSASADAPVAGDARRARFEAEVSSLKLTGGRVSSERILGRLSGIGIIVGLLISFLAYRGTRSSVTALELADNGALAELGLTLTVASTGVYLAMSLRRYLRYWLLRLIYEQRQVGGLSGSNGHAPPPA